MFFFHLRWNLGLRLFYLDLPCLLSVVCITFSWASKTLHTFTPNPHFFSKTVSFLTFSLLSLCHIADIKIIFCKNRNGKTYEDWTFKKKKSMADVGAVVLYLMGHCCLDSFHVLLLLLCLPIMSQMPDSVATGFFCCCFVTALFLRSNHCSAVWDISWEHNKNQ